MDKTRQWSILTVVGVIGVLIAGWFLMVSPQRAHATDLRAQAEQQRQSNAQLQSKVAMLRQQAKDLPSQQARLAAIAKKIPDNPALPPLIRALSDASDTAGIELVSLAPSAPAVVAATAPQQLATGTQATQPAQPTRGAATAPAQLAQIPVAIQVQGTYFNIEQFFDAVESLSRAMLVTGITMAPVPGAGAVATSPGAKVVPAGTMTATITARVFMAPTVALPNSVKPVASAPAAK
jgi:type IV pilus assembly protein PilO